MRKARFHPRLLLLELRMVCPGRARVLESGSSVERIAPALEKIVSGSLRRAPAGQAPILAWPLACGSAVAARTSALSFDNGILRVEVPDAGWRPSCATWRHNIWQL